MLLPTITEKQKEILFLLYKFRFLNTNQFQILLNHKSPSLIQNWLKDLFEKKYVGRNYERLVFGDNTKPAIYYLSSKARHILKTREDVDILELNRIYNEKRREKKFIDRCIFIAEIYLFFVKNKNPEDTLHFLPRAQLRGLDYFPKPLPDVYIVVESKDETKRYFLDFFEEYVPSFVLRKRVKQYLKYVGDKVWEENTQEAESPTILFVCPHEKRRKHIFFYGKNLIERSYVDLDLYLTTKDIILKGSEINNIWVKVE